MTLILLVQKWCSHSLDSCCLIISKLTTGWRQDACFKTFISTDIYIQPDLFSYLWRLNHLAYNTVSLADLIKAPWTWASPFNVYHSVSVWDKAQKWFLWERGSVGSSKTWHSSKHCFSGICRILVMESIIHLLFSTTSMDSSCFHYVSVDLIFLSESIWR